MPVNLLLVLLPIIGFAECKSAETKPYKKIPRFEKQVSKEEILSQKITPVYTYGIVRTYPHDVISYTEGHLMNGRFLNEANGRHDKSKVVSISLVMDNGSSALLFLDLETIDFALV